MTTPNESTSSLVDAIQRGDTRAQEQLFERYIPRVRQMVALRIGKPVADLPGDADDIVQQTLLNALQAVSQFEHRSEGAFRAWIARIVENALKNEHRNRRSNKHQQIWQRHGDLDLRETMFPDEGHGPSSIAEQKELNERIEAVILSLPALYRRTLELRDIAGMNYLDLAEALGRTEPNCRKIYQRAREMLQDKLR